MTPARLPAAGFAWMLGRAALLLCVAVVVGLGAHGRAQAAETSQMLSEYQLKLGASYSTAFIQVERNIDGATARLISDSDYSPYVSFSSPPFFLGGSGFALGLSSTYSQFTASKQNFTAAGPAAIDDVAKGQFLVLTASLSYYLGRSNETQYFLISGGAGVGWARFGGAVQFGQAAGQEPPEELHSPTGTSPAVLFALEYRLGPVSLAYYGGGPNIETDRHNYTLGDDSIVLSYVFGL